ncbi:hypothetical protein TNCV_1662191 [Trichonephila clavipes]|nr:hypothetical protein TNCV_1662191 [Trichonephila clavipes]
MFEPPIRTLSLRQATSTISIWDGGTLRVPFPSDIQRRLDVIVLEIHIPEPLIEIASRNSFRAGKRTPSSSDVRV